MTEGRASATSIVVVATIFRLVLAAFIPLFPDETYYWDWSRHLAGGYFDHPPAIAWLIAAGTAILPTSAFAVRLLPVLAGGAATWFAVLIARRLAAEGAARTAALAFSLMPLAATGLVLATPDAPLLAASAAALYFVVVAVQAPAGTREALRAWCAAGFMLGLAFSSKYTSILLPVMVTIAVLLRPSLRARLREAGPYVACVIATLVFLPVLYWNAKHDWISFRFQIEHGLGTPKGSAIKRELDLVGGQLGLVSPILFALAAYAVWTTLRKRADDARFLLAVVATGSWVFFAYSAMRRSVEANWPAPSYVPGLALLAALPASVARERWLRRGFVLAAVMVGVIYVHSLVPILPLPARRDPVARSAGWDGLAAAVQQARASLGTRTHVAADRYQDVSELAYHLPDRPAVYCTCLGGRRNQYELWQGFREGAVQGDNLVIAVEDTSATAGSPNKIAAHFAEVRRGELVPVLRGADTVAMRRLWYLRSYRGGWPTRQ